MPIEVTPASNSNSKGSQNIITIKDLLGMIIDVIKFEVTGSLS